MKTIEFEELKTIDVQTIIDDRSVDITVERVSADISKGEFELTGYELECCDEVDVCDILNLSFDDPVICERAEVEDAVMFSEYETLKISDDRRGEEVKLLEEKLEASKGMYKRLCGENLRLTLTALPWYRKLRFFK